jgi:subfamily B ATP-binding cassette protein MsbA
MGRKNAQSYQSFEMYKRLLWEVKAFWPLLILAIIGSIVYSAADSYAIYLLKPIINKGIAQQNAGYLKEVAIFILILFTLRGTGKFVSALFMGKFGQNVVFFFRTRLFNKFLVLPAYYYDQNSSGTLLSKLLYNVNQITQATGSALKTVAQDGAFVIGLLVVMLTVSWKLSMMVFVIAPFMGLFISWMSKRFRRLSKKTQTAMGDLTHVAEEALLSYREIRIFGAQDYQATRFYQKAHYTFSQQVKVLMTDALASPVVQITGAIILAIALYIAAIVGTGAQSWLKPGSFVAFFTSLLSLLKPLQRLMNVNSKIQKALAATEDLYYVIDHPEEENQGTITLQSVYGNVTFENVSFRYATNDEWVLNDINLEVKAGETVALVGRSGGGKSTLMTLIPRFYNAECGRITLDNEDIKSLELTNLRSHIAYVSQQIALFDDSVYNNIAFGKQNQASDDEIKAAAQDANALDFINDLPEGFNTPIGQNGANLSGGQRQRIAIARAILKDAPVLILDEATSALDMESEKAVQSALERVMKGRTTFVVAHRLSTIENADKIVVMEKGQIAEQGSHDELIRADGIYASLYAQTKTSQANEGNNG